MRNHAPLKHSQKWENAKESYRSWRANRDAIAAERERGITLGEFKARGLVSFRVRDLIRDLRVSGYARELLGLVVTACLVDGRSCLVAGIDDLAQAMGCAVPRREPGKKRTKASTPPRCAERLAELGLVIVEPSFAGGARTADDGRALRDAQEQNQYKPGPELLARWARAGVSGIGEARERRHAPASEQKHLVGRTGFGPVTSAAAAPPAADPPSSAPSEAAPAADEPRAQVARAPSAPACAETSVQPSAPSAAPKSRSALMVYDRQNADRRLLDPSTVHGSRSVPIRNANGPVPPTPARARSRVATDAPPSAAIGAAFGRADSPRRQLDADAINAALAKARRQDTEDRRLARKGAAQTQAAAVASQTERQRAPQPQSRAKTRPVASRPSTRVENASWRAPRVPLTGTYAGCRSKAEELERERQLRARARRDRGSGSPVTLADVLGVSAGPPRAALRELGEHLVEALDERDAPGSALATPMPTPISAPRERRRPSERELDDAERWAELARSMGLDELPPWMKR